MNTKWILFLLIPMGVVLLCSGCGAPTRPDTADTPTFSGEAGQATASTSDIMATQSTQETMTVTVYFSQGDQKDCAAILPLERTVAASLDVATAVLKQLFAGPTEAERAEGYHSWFSAETASILLSLRLDGSKAYLNMKDIRPIISGANSSCGSQMFFAQIETTLKAVAPVEEVFYAIEGDPVAFYEWIQLGCDPVRNNCDPAPFVVP